MAGSAVVTPSNVGFQTNAVRNEIAWIADGTGAVNVSSITVAAGSFLSVEFIPSTTAPPTTGYSVDLQTPAGVSLFSDGNGGNIGSTLSATIPKVSVPFINGTTATYVRSWAPGGGNYVFTVTGAGAGGQGKVIIFTSSSAL